jgi:hypothetical protein
MHEFQPKKLEPRTIIPQHSSESLSALDLADDGSQFITRFDDSIVEPVWLKYSAAP